MLQKFFSIVVSKMVSDFVREERNCRMLITYSKRCVTSSTPRHCCAMVRQPATWHRAALMMQKVFYRRLWTRLSHYYIYTLVSQISGSTVFLPTSALTKCPPMFGEIIQVNMKCSFIYQNALILRIACIPLGMDVLMVQWCIIRKCKSFLFVYFHCSC